MFFLRFFCFRLRDSFIRSRAGAIAQSAGAAENCLCGEYHLQSESMPDRTHSARFKGSVHKKSTAEGLKEWENIVRKYFELFANKILNSSFRPRYLFLISGLPFAPHSTIFSSWSCERDGERRRNGFASNLVSLSRRWAAAVRLLASPKVVYARALAFMCARFLRYHCAFT